MRRLTLVIALALALPTAAYAQLPDVGGPPAGNGNPTATGPAPSKGSMSIRVRSGLVDRKARYVASGQSVLVRGRVRPFVKGQAVEVSLFRGKQRVSRKTVPVKKSGKVGVFSLRLKAKRAGGYRVKAHHAGTAQQQAFSARTQAFRALSARAGRGSRGVKVRLLQRGLKALGYVTPLGGRFDGATSRAVLAFRKVNGMSRTGYASRAVFGNLFRGRGGFSLKYPRAGKHAEVDISRQVLVLARGRRVERIYHASTGKSSTPTVLGTYRFYRKDSGTNSVGMVHSSYFIRGYAIHGYKSVPTYPASHGCVRVPIPNARSIYNWIRMGERIMVYR